ncbi:MAG TPA: alpha/beta fold hydrolase [Kofleriaceae bacterium]|jgi:thioesterase domain-containing protein|nr:alpha/beta fold hydrolase [Kofleriaceae bacterium]
MDPEAVKRELLALLAQEDRPAPAATDNPFHASLVRLHTGKKRPFYCVHPGSGAVGCFSEIAPLVDRDRTFIGVQAPGIDGEREPFNDLVALARGYVAEILRAQPEGPYLLGGWSLGGMVAFHMAHELRRQGAEVALLVLFDTQRADAMHGVPFSREVAVEVLYRHNALAAEHLAFQQGVKIDREAVFRAFMRERPRSTPSRLDLMLRLLVQNGVFHDATAPMFRVFRANILALGDYGMPVEPYDRTLTLFRCENDTLGHEYTLVDETYCWSKSVASPVEVVRMPTHHFALFHGDVLPLTAARLRECLDRSDPS